MERDGSLEDGLSECSLSTESRVALLTVGFVEVVDRLASNFAMIAWHSSAVGSITRELEVSVRIVDLSDMLLESNECGKVVSDEVKEVSSTVR